MSPAVVFERNKAVQRRVSRVLVAAGWEVRLVEVPETLDAPATFAEGGGLIVADAFDADLVVRLLAAHPTLQAALYSAEPLDRLLGRALAEPRLVALLGRPSFEVPPREADLLHVAQRARGAAPLPFAAFLHWGARGFAYSITDGNERNAAIAEVMAFAQLLGAPRRSGEMLAELTHELVMNALYDAPVDAAGRVRFAHDRKADIKLGADEAAVLRVASDGVRVAVEVSDRFGRLERHHVFGGLQRALASGELDTSGGGAGLGMMLAYRSTNALFYDVEPGQRTRVTGLFELDLNQREFRSQPKTLHFPPPAGG